MYSQFLKGQRCSRLSRIIENLKTESSLTCQIQKQYYFNKRFVRNGSKSKSKSLQGIRSPKQIGISYIKNPFQAKNFSKNKRFKDKSLDTQKNLRQQLQPKNAQQISFEPQSDDKQQQNNIICSDKLNTDQSKHEEKVLDNDIIKDLQQKLKLLQQKLKQKEDQNQNLLQKIDHTTHYLKDTSRQNNLTKLKKQIALSKNAQLISSNELLQQQIQQLLSQNKMLKQKILIVQSKLKNDEILMQKILHEKQEYLYSIINSLKHQLYQKDKLLFQYEININISNLKYVNRDNNKVMVDDEQKIMLKFKHDSWRKKYQQLYKEHKIFKNKVLKQQKQNYLFSNQAKNQACRLNDDDPFDFSLSPQKDL